MMELSNYTFQNLEHFRSAYEQWGDLVKEVSGIESVKLTDDQLVNVAICHVLADYRQMLNDNGVRCKIDLK